MNSRTDPYIPLLCWWAVEQHAVAATQAVLDQFATADAWDRPIIRDVLLGRLIRRFVAEGSGAGFAASLTLLESAPDPNRRREMLGELDAGLALIGRQKRTGLPLGTAFSKIAIREQSSTPSRKRFESVPPQFAELVDQLLQEDSDDALNLRLAVRLGSDPALDRTIQLAVDRSADESARRTAVKIVGELGDDRSVPTLLPVLESDEPEPIRAEVTKVLARFTDDSIPQTALKIYPDSSPTLRGELRSLLFGRASWAMQFLELVDEGTYSPKEVSLAELRRLALHEDASLSGLVRKHWGNIRAGTPEEKLAEIRRLNNDLRAAAGRMDVGHELYKKHCATCHRYFDEGNRVGPELTNANRKDREYLLVSLVDPNSQIRKEYMSYIVVMDDGRVLNGLLVDQTPAKLTLVNAKNERTTVLRDEIDELKESPVSLMPENLLKQLKPQEIRDLFAYLQK